MRIPGRDYGATRPEALWSSPAIVNGIVYVGSDDHNVFPLKATTGTKVWNYTTGDLVSSAVVRPRPSPNGIVYIGKWDHNIYRSQCDNRGEGVELHDRKLCDSSAPTVANGVVYVGSMDHNVYAS